MDRPAFELFASDFEGSSQENLHQPHEPLIVNQNFLGPAQWEALERLTQESLKTMHQIISGESDATLKERLEVIKMVLAKTLPDAWFVESLKRQLNGEEDLDVVPKRLGVVGYDPDCI
ncbi:MAG: hypothetical protein K2X66_16355 [Cyanobacteria bacterium]|nr:hypothetical protein [Cyanobacteriota bacterium]